MGGGAKKNKPSVHWHRIIHLPAEVESGSRATHATKRGATYRLTSRPEPSETHQEPHPTTLRALNNTVY